MLRVVDMVYVWYLGTYSGRGMTWYEGCEGWNDDAARQQLLKLFEFVWLEDPWVSAQRRRLSAILFG